MDVSSALKDFQAYNGLNVNGQLDQPTLHLMSMPRCGNKDKFSKRRSKRYAIQGKDFKN